MYYLVSYLLLHLCHMLVVSFTMTPQSPLLLLGTVTLVASDWCPEAPGWLLVGNSCYLVSVHKLSWHQAQEFCWGQGGNLAELQSQNEEDLLDQVLVQGIEYWIGLTDIAQEGSKSLYDIY